MSEEDDIIKWLIEIGILKDLGYDEEIGDHLYYIEGENTDLFPEIMEEHQKDINEAIFDLWQLDMIDVAFDDFGDPLISLNKNSLDKNKIEQIEDPALKGKLKTIVEIFTQQFGN